jgi:pimeloyl-ACP methyl ester carboxylesterase
MVMKCNGLLSVGATVLGLGLNILPLPANAAACDSIEKPKCQVELQTGIRMTYLETGPKDGKAVILLHGLTDSARSWAPTMAELHKIDPSLRIFALDQRGHGQTSMPAGADCPAAPKTCFTPALFAADVVAFMDEKGIDKAVLAGHSMGSIVAQAAALAAPEWVEALVLVATSAKTKDNAIVRDYVLNEPVLGSWKKALEAKGITSPEAVWNATPRDADPKADEWIAKNWDVDILANPAFVQAIVPETAVVKMGTWIGATSALLDFDNTAALANLQAPTLVLWGMQDAIFYRDPDQTGILAALKNSKAKFVWKEYGVIPLPNSGYQESDIGHNIQWEVPAAVAADIASFVKTGRPTPDLTRAEVNGAAVEIITEPGKAKIETRN